MLEVLQQIAAFIAPALIVLAAVVKLYRMLQKQYVQSQEAIKAHGDKVAIAVRDDLVEYQTSVRETLSRIEAQTTRTNGRVSALELQNARFEGILLGRAQTKDL